jgi:Uncharacterized protein conserved in bacteria (DUF2066)
MLTEGMLKLRLRLGALALLLVVATPPRLAAADDDYSATVTVDATSDTVAKARDVARVDGARRALAAVVDKLSGGSGKAKPLKLSDNQITDLVASFEVASEKMTAVRYTADYTFHFRQGEVTKAMQAAGIAIGSTGGNPPAADAANAAAAGAKPVVVLPVYQNGATAVLWDEPNPWRLAWAQLPAQAGGPNLVMPFGDVGDVAAIDADKARSGDARAISAIAKKEGASDVLVLVASERPPGGKPGLDVAAKRYRDGQFADAHADSIDANPGEKPDDLFRRAVQVIAADIGNGWKDAKSGIGDQQGTLTVVAAIAGLDDWLNLRGQLAGLPQVRKIDVKSLSRQEATVEISYVGAMDQLKASLTASKLDLEGGDPTWRLARTP